MNYYKALKQERSSIQYEAQPMALMVSFEKKIKKKDTLELAKLYNQKCFGLYDQIEHQKEEIEEYKKVIVLLRSSLIDQYSQPSKEENKESNQIEQLKRSMSQEYSNKEATYKTTIELLEKEIGSLREENLNLKTNLSKMAYSLKQTEETLNQIKTVQSKQFINHAQATELQEKMNQVLLENLFLMYLLNRSLNYEKIIKQINSKFNFYYDLFVCNKKDINIYSSILYELLYRIHNKVDIESLAKEVFLSNSITKGEDYQIQYTQSELLSTGLINEKLLLKLNDKVACYRNASLEEITKLINSCQNKVNTEPSLEILKKFNVSNVYNITSNGKLKIYCNKLIIDTVLFLVNTIRYCTEEIQIVELNGNININDSMIETYAKFFYQLKTNYGDKVKLLLLNNITNMNEEFITNCLNKVIEYLPNLLKIRIDNCGLTSELLSHINISNSKLIELDLSNNKIRNLDFFQTITPCESIILKNNPIEFKKGDGKIPFVKLDLSNNAFDVRTMNEFNNWMKESSVLSLNLSNVKIEQDTGILLGNTVEELKQLKCLILNNIGLTEDCTPLVLNHLNKTSIEELYLNDNHLGEIGSLIITSLLQSNNSLKKIELARCNIGSIGIQSLVSAIKHNESLTHINLEENNFLKEEVTDIIKIKDVII